jgi:hypothetical protein
MLTKNLDGPLDDCKDLGPEQLENLNGWIERFDEKVSDYYERNESGEERLTRKQYLVVGKLIPFRETEFH